MKNEDRCQLSAYSDGVAAVGAVRRPWKAPVLTGLKSPADAQGGLLIGPEVIVLLS